VVVYILPPLVHNVRRGVKQWRDSGYVGASNTTRALLNDWLQTEHLMPQADGTVRSFE
jgi:type III restriction enzyme